MIYKNIPMADYLAMRSYSASNLKYMLQSPADFSASLTQQKETAATILGTAIHCALCEPAHFNERYACEPEDWGPHNAGIGYKKWREFKEANPTKIALNYEDSQKIYAIMRAAQKNSVYRKIIDGSESEVTGDAIYHTTGVLEDKFCPAKIPIRARADILSQNCEYDIKTTSEGITDEEISRTILKYGYHFQAYHHLQVFKKNEEYKKLRNFGWIFVSTNTPAVHVVCKIASQKMLAAAKNDWNAAIDMLTKCLLNNDFPGLDSENTLKEIDLPAWC